MTAQTLSTDIGRSLWDDARLRLMRNKAAVAGLVVLGLVTLLSIFGPYLTGHAFDRVYPEYTRVPAGLSAYPRAEQVAPAIERISVRLRARAEAITVNGGEVRFALVAPRAIDERGLAFFDRSDMFGPAEVIAREGGGQKLVIQVPIEYRRFWFGTDANGRDLLTRTLIAGRVSLAIGLLAAGVGVFIGVIYGATSGYFGGRVDDVMMRIVDIIYALPFIFFVIMLVVFFGRNFVLMFIAVGAVEWLDMARIVRGPNAVAAAGRNSCRPPKRWVLIMAASCGVTSSPMCWGLSSST